MAVIFCGAVNGQEAPAPQELSIPAARTLAREAALAGDIRVAETVALSLLERDPTDAEALLALAIVERQRGNLKGSSEQGAQAYRNSDIPALRFDAAFLVADAAARQEQYTRAQIWLRRADQAAPDDQRRALAARSYQQVRARNPLNVQLSFTLRPSDNINNGTNGEVDENFVIGGFPGRGLPPLEGFEATVSAAGSYRLSEDQTQRTELLSQIYLRKAFISESELGKIPGAEAEDYDYASLLVGVRHSRRLNPDWGITRATLRFGHTYFEQSSYSNLIEGEVSQDVRLSDQTLLRFGAGLRDETRLGTSDAASSETWTVSTDAFFRNEVGRWSLGLVFDDIRSESPGVDGRAVEARLRHAWSAPVFDMVTPDVALTVRERQFPNFIGRARTDVTVRASVGLTFNEARAYGFVPSVEATFSRTDSDIDVFDSQSSGLGFSMVSRF